MQKFAFGFLNLKPHEFWELTPSEFLLMKQGFELKNEHDFKLQVQTLRVLRHIGYTVYATTPKKKGTKNISVLNYLPLPLDKEIKGDSKPVSETEFKKIVEFYNNKFKA